MFLFEAQCIACAQSQRCCRGFCHGGAVANELGQIQRDGPPLLAPKLSQHLWPQLPARQHQERGQHKTSTKQRNRQRPADTSQYPYLWRSMDHLWKSFGYPRYPCTIYGTPWFSIPRGLQYIQFEGDNTEKSLSKLLFANQGRNSWRRLETTSLASEAPHACTSSSQLNALMLQCAWKEGGVIAQVTSS